MSMQRDRAWRRYQVERSRVRVRRWMKWTSYYEWSGELGVAKNAATRTRCSCFACREGHLTKRKAWAPSIEERERPLPHGHSREKKTYRWGIRKQYWWMEKPREYVFGWYRSERERDEALAAMRKKERLTRADGSPWNQYFPIDRDLPG